MMLLNKQCIENKVCALSKENYSSAIKRHCESPSFAIGKVTIEIIFSKNGTRNVIICLQVEKFFFQKTYPRGKHKS